MFQLKARTREEAIKEAYRYAIDFASANVDCEENPSGGYYNDLKFYDKEFDSDAITP